MLKARLLTSTQNLRLARACAGVLGVVIALLAPAFGQSDQDFTVSMAPFPPPASLLPGGTAAAAITVSPQGSFSGTIDLTCQATPQPAGFPSCQVSPSSLTLPNEAATATVTTTGSTPSGQYAFVVTGTSGTSTATSAPDYLTVLSVAPNFTISVTQQVEPNAVHAGSGGQGIVSLTPNGGYSGNVTLSCATVIPLVSSPPTCSFSYPPNMTSLPVPGPPSTVSINTIGPNNLPPSARAWRAPEFWMPVVALAGVGVASSRRSRRALCLLALVVLAGSILLAPACGHSNVYTTSETSNNNLITPKNSYTFTVTGVDDNGVVPSNTGTSAPTVTLTVN